MIKKILFSLLLAITIGVATSQASEMSSTHYKWNNDINKEIKALLDEWRLDNKIHAVELSISLPGESHMRDFYSGNSTSSKLNSANLFRVDSVTKSFTTALLLRLEAKGLLNINDPLGNYLHQDVELTSEEYAAWHTIKLKQLLNQTSGIFDYSQSEKYQQINLAYNFDKAWSDKELIQFAIEKSPYFKPGKGWHYSNTNYVLAGMVVEAVTGKSVEYEMNDELLGETNANLVNTYYLPYSYNKLPSIYWNDQVSERFIHGYEGEVDVTHANASAFGASGALVSTSHDLAKWTRMLFGGEILPPAQLKEMQSIVAESGSLAGQPIPITSENFPDGYGLGIIQLYTDPHYGIFWWHDGGGFGYHALFLWSLKNNVVIGMTHDQQNIPIEPNNPVIIAILDLLDQKKLTDM